MKYIRKQTPARILALGFLAVILLGSFLLMLPCSVRPGVDLHYVDALFTSTSAVCVTGLIAVDTADTYTAFGQAVVAALIQIGGLGVTSVGVGFILAMGKRVNLKERLLIREAMNLDSGRGLVSLVKNILKVTLVFELAGAVLSFLVFRRDYPFVHAVGISLFHSIAAFNNSGFDILGGLKNLSGYRDNVLLNLTTAGLITFGGLGFLVIMDIVRKRSFKKLCLHSKAVITTSAILLVVGTVLIRMTEQITWLGAFFYQRFRQNRRIFYIFPGKLYKRRASDGDGVNVYRGIPGVHRRRYQDQHAVYPVPYDPGSGYQWGAEGISLSDSAGGILQGGGGEHVVDAGGLRRFLCHVCAGAGAGIYGYSI